MSVKTPERLNLQLIPVLRHEPVILFQRVFDIFVVYSPVS